MWREGRTSRLSPAPQDLMPRPVVLPASSPPPPGLPADCLSFFFAGQEENPDCFLLPLRADRSQTKPASLSELFPLFYLSGRAQPSQCLHTLLLVSPYPHLPRFHLMTKPCVPASEMPGHHKCSSSGPCCYSLSSGLMIWDQCYYPRFRTGREALIFPPPEGPPHAFELHTCPIKPGLETLPHPLLFKPKHLGTLGCSFQCPPLSLVARHSGSLCCSLPAPQAHTRVLPAHPLWLPWLPRPGMPPPPALANSCPLSRHSLKNLFPTPKHRALWSPSSGSTLYLLTHLPSLGAYLSGL